MPDIPQPEHNPIPGLDTFALDATSKYGLTDMRITRSEGEGRGLDIDAIHTDDEAPDGIVIGLYWAPGGGQRIRIGDRESPMPPTGFNGATHGPDPDYQALNLTRRRTDPIQKGRYEAINVMHFHYVQATRIEENHVAQASLRFLEVIDAAAREHSPGPQPWPPTSRGQSLVAPRGEIPGLPDLKAFGKTVTASGLTSVRVRVSPEWGPLRYDIAAAIPGTVDAPHGIPVGLQWIKPWAWEPDADWAGQFLRIGDGSARCSSEYDIDLDALGFGRLEPMLIIIVARAARALWSIHHAIEDLHLAVIMRASDDALASLGEVAERRTRPGARQGSAQL